MPKKKKPASKASARIRWEFDPDIPTDDFFDGRNLDELWDLQEAVDNFVSMMNGGTFLTWEAVVCEEQGLPLTPKQKKALGSLLDFNDEEEDDGILYIDEMPRPSEPWYAILNKIAPHLLIEHRRFGQNGEDATFATLRRAVARDKTGHVLAERDRFGVLVGGDVGDGVVRHTCPLRPPLTAGPRSRPRSGGPCRESPCAATSGGDRDTAG